MQIRISILSSLLKPTFIFLITGILSISCKTPPVSTTNLKMISVSSLSKNDLREIPENIQELCTILKSDTKTCFHAYFIEPVILRLDLGKEFSLKTTLEKGGAKNINNPNVIDKEIKNNFSKLEIPKDFISAQAPSTDASKLIADFATAKSFKDSILVLSENDGSDFYNLMGKKYKVFTTVEEVRSKMLSILCQNEKANFTLLINPPEVSTVHQTNEAEPSSTSATINPTDSKTRKVVGLQKVYKTTVSKRGSYTGDLTIIKGSDGCDICTRYYSATDNLGRIHEVREKNSINCCPCGKTIEMNGRTYRMDCQGSPHLELM